MACRGEKRAPVHDSEDRRNAGQNRDAGVSARLAVGPAGLGSLILEQRVSDDDEWEAPMPERIHPGSTLGPGAEQAGWREQAWEGERMCNCDERGEQIAARQHEQRARPQEGELAK